MKPEPITLEIRVDNSDLLAKLAEAQRVMAHFDARAAALRAREALHSAVAALDDHRHPTGLENAKAALTACQDLVDAIDHYERAEAEARPDSADVHRRLEWLDEGTTAMDVDR